MEGDNGGLYRSNDDMKSNIMSDQAYDVRPSEEHAQHNIWDSLESDTESLVQEKAYQRELQKRIMNCNGEDDPTYNDKSETNTERSEDEEVYDPHPGNSETPGGQNTKFSSEIPPWDEYSELRYDPDWRKKLTGSEFYQPNLSFDSNEDPGDILRHARHVSPGERHGYLIIRSPVSSETGSIPPKPLLSSFHLHPPEEQNTVLSVRQSSTASLESTPHLNHQQSAVGMLPFSSPRQRQRAQSRQRQHDEEIHSTDHKQNVDKLNLVAMQRRCAPKVRPIKAREDIVERNKATLGLNSHKQGSYLKVYEQKGGKANDANQSQQSADDTTSTDSPGSPDNALNLELMWIQKTQKLKTHNQSKHLGRARPHHHRSKPRGHANQPVKKQPSQILSEKQTSTSPPESGSISHCSCSKAPTVNLNINLNTPGKLAEPFINPESQKQPYTLTHAPSIQWRPSYTLYPPLLPAGTVDHDMMQVTSKNSIRSYQTQPPVHEGLTSDASQLVVPYREESWDAAYGFSGAYPVLPPIGRSNDTDTELCSGRTEEVTNTLHRSSSEGYLAQLNRQKQIEAKTNYKAYTLKDYKNLNQEVKLGGLGPSNTVAENVAEKIRQQKLYSNVIREQNKKISRIPSLLTRTPVGSGNKDNIPRNKALEYAKTIAKPKAPQQLKERPSDNAENERGFEHSAYLQLGVDLTQLSIIKMLRKQHEQEKQVVARFTNINDSSTSSSVNSQ